MRRAAYRRLHDTHAFFLEPGTDDIRLSRPITESRSMGGI